MTDPTYDVTPPVVTEFLIGADEFVEPKLLLGDLTEGEALTRPPGCPRSIAEIAAHILFWSRRLTDRQAGEDLPPVDDNEITFRIPGDMSWSELRDSLFEAFEVLEQSSEENGDSAAYSREEATVSYEIAERALHHAYHWGQIALIRCMLGLWPPAGAIDD